MSGPGGTGFFGKLPGVGDFVQRRLPAAFVTAWDAGFEMAVSAARSGFGTDWLVVWQAAPPWRFALMPGVCSDSAWVGVMGPATDRVGRGFPMVLACHVNDTSALARVVAEGGGWFAAVENVYRRARIDAATTVEAFDAMVSALPDPLAPMEHDAAIEPASRHGTLHVAWRQDGEDRQLAALWSRCSEADDGCMWWTTGSARVAPAVRLTRGLPAPHDYAAFLDDTSAKSCSHAGDTFAAPASNPDTAHARVTIPAVSRDDLDDVLSDLLAPPHPVPLDAPALSTSGWTDTQDAVAQPRPDTAAGVAQPVSRWCEQQFTLVAADNGLVDPRRSAAARVVEALADPAAPVDMQHVRDRLSALHPELRQRSEDLIDPVPEDAALVIARVTGDCAELLRAGAADAWHWRRGQLRPLFVADVDPMVSEADTLRPGDLTGILSRVAAGHNPGLGAADTLRLDETHCTVVNGDRLLLMATDTLVQLPADTLAGAMQAASSDEARARIAAAAGLRTERAQWPVAVIEVGA